MAGREDKEVLYRFIVTPTLGVDETKYSACMQAFSDLPGFSLSSRSLENREAEYKHLAKGKTQCSIYLTRMGVKIETSRKGVEKSKWKAWFADILQSLFTATKWKAADIGVLAVVYQYRFPRLGNNYRFLCNQLFAGSRIHNLVGDLNLLDSDMIVYGRLQQGIQLILRATSNQAKLEILSNNLDDEDNRLLLEFHAISNELKGNAELPSIAVEHEKALEEWLEDRNESLQEIMSALCEDV